MQSAQTVPAVQVIVPARNEQDLLGRCLESLARQQGVAFHVTVVDDHSSDQTRAIAESFPTVRVIGAGEPPPGFSGKCNALIRGTEGATAKWLLFTDADTFHYPGSLAAAVGEAEERGLDLLSYSPEQEVVSWGEMALMPVVFADLARAYPPERVNNPADPAAAANGQYVLVRREAYEALGGHRAVADKILEDVELARLFKESHKAVWFRHGAGLVRTRMYRNLPSMIEGWTKNLSLLFARPLALAAVRTIEFSGPILLLAAGALLLAGRSYSLALGAFFAAAFIYGRFLWRVRRAHFHVIANLLSFFGLPLFSWLLLRAWLCSRPGRAITWKGRVYSYSETERAQTASIAGHSEAEFN